MTRYILSLLAIAYFTSDFNAQDFSAFEYRELGPFRGGRVTAVAGIAAQPSVFYLGATGAGVWKTEDYGTSWKNISDGYFSTPSIGSISVAQNDPNIIYVGTGSDGLRSNVIAGKGMYKSINGGETWEHIGLEKTGQIGAVRIHPSNHNIVYVAAIGQAFNSNQERGIYRTMNGGETWEKVLFLTDQVGFSDVELMPSNPAIIYAAAWKAERKPWTIISGGTAEEGGIYKSVDGGQTWKQVTQGLPQNLIGKIDLEVTPADSRVVYALVEAPEKEGGLYKSVDQGKSFTQISSDKDIRTRPFYYTNVKVDPTNPDVVFVMSTGYFKSVDGGKKWNRLRPPHGDNHDMWINPDNPDLFIQANDGGANVTHNGGKTWSTQFNQPTSEIYQIEVDDQYPYWVYGGQQDNSTTVAVPSLAPYGIQAPGIGYIMNTGGCETGPAVPKPGNHNIVYANCKGRFGVFDKRTGTEKQYYVGAANMYGQNPKNLKYRFQRVSPIHVSPHDADVVYHCSQYVHRTADDGKTWKTISPDLTAFEADKQVISGSPITRDITGEEFYSTIYAIRESVLSKGLIWVGANDGPIHVTRDAGLNWKNVTPANLPGGGRVDAVEPSSHHPAKAYACILRYQLGDWKPYIYRTNNYGGSWKLLTNGKNGIPQDFPVRVVREDPEREGLLYAGTEYGLFISLDDGENWKPFQQNLPVTPITDIKIIRGDLTLSTMGRGFWVLDNISSLRQADINKQNTAMLFQPKNTFRYKYPSGARNSQTPTYPRPSVIIDYLVPDSIAGVLKMEIKNTENEVVATFISDTSKTKISEEVIEDMATNRVEYIVDNSLKTKPGLNRFHWDMTMTGPWHEDKKRRYKNGPAAKPGNFTVTLSIDDQELSQSFELLLDPRMEKLVTMSDLNSQIELQFKISDLLSNARMLEDKLETEKSELKKLENLTSEQNERLDQIKTLINTLKTKDGIYEKPGLVAQISYLYAMLNDTDQAPGNDAYARLKELESTFNDLAGNEQEEGMK